MRAVGWVADDGARTSPHVFYGCSSNVESARQRVRAAAAALVILIVPSLFAHVCVVASGRGVCGVHTLVRPSFIAPATTGHHRCCYTN
jgi:cation transporter-like permease